MLKWPKSSWRQMRVEWDESVVGERQERVSPWEIKPFVSISNLPPQGTSQKRRPPTLMADLYPPGISESVFDTYQSNKLARFLNDYDHRDELGKRDKGDGDTESRQTSSSLVIQEQLPKTGSWSWFPLPNLSSFGILAGSPYQISPMGISGAPLTTPQLPDSVEMLLSEKLGTLDQSPNAAVSKVTQALCGDPPKLQTVAAFPIRDPNLTSKALPSLFTSSKLGDSNGSALLSGSGKVIRPAALGSNNSIMIPLRRRSLKLGNKSEQEKLSACEPLEHPCKLFGFNLTEKALLAPISSRPSHCDYLEESGLQPTTQEFSHTFVATRRGIKVYQEGKVGRTIELKKCDGYTGLRSMVASLFNLEGLLDDLTSGWLLVYTDNENDLLFVGDDPWKDFCKCVVSLKILSPEEVRKFIKIPMNNY